MRAELELMMSLVRVENILNEKVTIEDSGILRNLEDLDDELKGKLYEMYAIEDRAFNDKFVEIIRCEENLQKLKQFYRSLITNPDNVLSRKIQSICKTLNLSKDEGTLFQFIYLYNDCLTEIHFDKLFEFKFKYPNMLAEYLSDFFDLPERIIFAQIMDPNSNLNKFNLWIYEEPKLKVSFALRRFLSDPDLVSFEDYIFGCPFNGRNLDFPFSDDKLRQIEDLSDLYKKNSTYRSMVFSHSNTLSLQVAKSVATSAGLKLLYLDVSPESIDWDVTEFALKSLVHLDLKDCLIYISLNYQIDRLKLGVGTISIIENILGHQRMRIIMHPEGYQRDSYINQEIHFRLDKWIDLIKSDRVTRDMVYTKILGETRMEDRFYRVEIKNCQLERLLKLNLNREELIQQICFFSKLDDLPISDPSKITVNYDYFNLSLCPYDLKAAVRKFIDLGEEAKAQIKRTSFILSGPPGTGKSLLAEAICLELGITYKKVRLTDFTSIYVHETEKKTREFFDSNSGIQALIFDEFDSLALNRENSSRRHEISEVNEFLNCMDEHRGIIFATTNNPDLIDSAALRRFDFKIRFGYLTPEIACEMFTSLFKDYLNNASDLQIIYRKLKSIKRITPALLTNIHRQSLLLGDNNLNSILRRLDDNLRSQRESIRLLNN